MKRCLGTVLPKITFMMIAMGIMSNTSYALDKRLKLFPSFSFYGQYVESTENKARVFGLSVSSEFVYQINDELLAFADASLFFEKGSHRALVVSEFRPEEEPLLNEGILRWTPYNFINIDAGAINQSRFSNPLLVDSVAFPGAYEKLTLLDTDLGKLSLSAEQAIPNNSILSNRTGQAEDGTPLFMIESISFESGETNSDNFSIALSHYMFSRLGPTVANQSRFMGNSVSGSGNDNSKFIYGFNGLSLAGNSSLYFSDSYIINLAANYIYNDKAPDGRNQGYNLFVEFGVKSFMFGGGIYSNESDTSPAFYNSKHLGHNNRQGVRLSLSGEINNAKSIYSINFYNSDLIDSSVLQSNMQILELKLSTLF